MQEVYTCTNNLRGLVRHQKSSIKVSEKHREKNLSSQKTTKSDK